MYLGWSLYDANVGYELNEAMEQIPMTFENETEANETLSASGRIINVNSQFGVDVYLLVDVSKSISNDHYQLSTAFIKALLEKVKLNVKI